MGFATREAAAKQASQSDAEFVRDTLRALPAQFAAVRDTFAQQQELGLPVGVTITDPSMAPLVQTLKQINDRMRSYNNGQDPITLPTSTELIDEARLGEFDSQASHALGLVAAAEETAALAALVPGETTQPTTRPRTITDLGPTPPQPVVAQPTTIPVPQPVPAPAVAEATGLSEEESQRYQTILDNLALIRDAPLATNETPGPTRSQQRKARQLYDDLKPLIEKLQNGETLTSQQRRKFDRLLTEAEAPDGLIASALPAVKEGEAERRRSEVGVAPDDPRQARIDGISALLGDRQDQVATEIRNRYADIWLLAEVPSNRMLDLLEQAAQATAPEAAQELISQADAIYAGEQQVYRTMLEVARDRAAGVAAALGERDGEGRLPLPTGSELEARSPDYYRTSPTLRGVHNGIEDIEGMMNKRSQDAGSYLSERGATGEQRGTLSFNYVFDLYQGVAAEDELISRLASLWQYARDHVDLSSADAEGLWIAYSASALMLVDPTYNPYESDYPRDVRNALVSRHLRQLGIVQRADEVSQAEVEAVMDLLRRNRQFRYDDIFFGVYQQVYSLAPQAADAALSAAIGQVALLRSETALYDIEYYPFTRPRGNMINLLTGEPMTFEDGTPMELTSPERLRMARDFLDHAMEAASASGMSADDPLLVAANKWHEWLDANADSIPAERIPVISDEVYQMAAGLTSLREAELWLSDDARGMRPSSLSDETLGEARQALSIARTLYLDDFTVPEVNGTAYYPGATYHPNQSRQWAGLAIRMVAPEALSVTDAPASSESVANYDNARVMGGTETEWRAAAQSAEEKHLLLLASLRDSPAFGIPAEVASWESWEAPYHLLNPAVGRIPFNPTEGMRSALSRDTGTLRSMTDTILDTHVIPVENSDPAFSDAVHDDRASYRWGLLVQEIDRQRRLQGDDSAPLALRTLDVAQFSAAQEAVSDAYATASPAELTVQADEVLLGILDARIEYIGRLLSGTRLDLAQTLQAVDGSLGTTTADIPANAGMIGTITAQQPTSDRPQEMVDADSAVAVRDYAKSIGIDPKAFIVLRALTEYNLLVGDSTVQPPVASLRDQLAARVERGEDVSQELRLAIAIAERALGDLSAIGTPYGALAEEGGIGHILPPPVPTQEYSVTVAYENTPERDNEGNRYWIAVATVKPEQPQNAIYYWPFYTPLGDGTWLLRNTRDAIANGEPQYIGMIVPNQTLPDGSTGCAVVRVRPASGPAARVGQWEPVGAAEEGRPEIDVSGRPAEVLYYVKDTVRFEPVEDDLLRRSRQEGLFDRTWTNQIPVPYSDTPPTPSVMVVPVQTR